MNATHDHAVAESSIDLTAVFSYKTIVDIPRAADSREVLTRLVRSLVHAGRLPGADEIGVIDALQAREQCSTTGLGNGLALPHLRCRAVADFVGAIGITAHGVNFNSLDGLPARVIVLLLSPFDQRERHAEIMGRLATLLSNETLQYSVRIARSPQALFRLLGF